MRDSPRSMDAPDAPRVRATSRSISRVVGQVGEAVEDRLAVEEPLEIRLRWSDGSRQQERSLAVTMRTPGHDRELAAGFLVTEGIIRSAADLLSIEADARTDTDSRIRVTLAPGVVVDWQRLERHFYTSSSCGVCGKTAIAAVETQACPIYRKDGPLVPPTVIHALPQRLRDSQAVFDQTGGLHASALFTPDGDLVAVFEDVGRHNALDKLIGDALLQNRLPLDRHILLVSGRVSFELVQKALMANIPILAAIGAPSSLAVELADEFDLTVIGFVRGERFNVYSGGWRILVEPAHPA